MEKRNKIYTNQRALNLTLCAAALASLFCTFDLLHIPADSKNAFLFGLSKERLLLFLGFCIIFIFNLFCLFHRGQTAEFLAKIKNGKSVCLFAGVTSLFILLMPDYRFGRFSAYYTRLRPCFLWLFLNALIFWMYYACTQDNFRDFRLFLNNLRGQKKFILPVLLVLVCGIAFVEITGLGKTEESSLWNKNGIPLQSIQLFTVIIIFALLNKSGILTRVGKKKCLNFFLIWVISALVWSLVPLHDHFFAPGPYAPNGQFYPYSDAFNYDFSSQTALHGWGFNMRRTLLKPTLAFITFLTHLATGNDINRSMMLQSAVFGILPAIIYLFGSSIGGNICGYLGAVFSIMKEWNALQTHTVMTIHSRLFMSEFLTQILLAVFCYALFHWIRRDRKESLYAIIAGGILTLGFFTRYNFAALLPAALLPLLISYRKNLLRLLKTLFFFLLTAAVTAAPLLYRDKDVSWGLIPELKYTVEHILFKNRLSNPSPEIQTADELSDSPVPELIYEINETPDLTAADIAGYSALPAEPAGQVVDTTENSAAAAQEPLAANNEPISNADEISENPVDTASTPVSSILADSSSTEGKTEISESTEFSEHTDPLSLSQTASVSETSTNLPETAEEEINTGQITQDLQNNSSTVILPVYQSILNHGLHNFIASCLTLPMEASFQNLEHLYTQETYSLWKDHWQGDFSVKQWIFIAAWTILGAVSLGILLKEQGLAGFSIPYFWLVYSFSVGVSRSSGGRYVVPTNWIPMLLLAFCITLFFNKGKVLLTESIPDLNTRKTWVWQPSFVFLLFSAFFWSMYLLENNMPNTNTTVPEGDLAVLQERLADKNFIDWELVKSQNAEGSMHITHGVAIYPRFYYFRDGENVNNDLLMWKDYSRMTFSGINLEGRWGNLISQGYLMPHMSLIEKFPQDSIFRAISCKSAYGYEDVLAVTIETKEGDVFTYVRDPLPAFSCPIPEPVCYSLENCY